MDRSGTMGNDSAPVRVRSLDGLRGLAVAGVLAYHCGFGWARGGFLGVSLFFTLSGFLICSLLLTERADTGRIALGSFWARRARRLLPAALVALLGIVVFGATVATGSQLRSLRGDVLAALGYVANWRFVLAGTSYASLWESPSPVQHFWSLAIEEQLYLALPLVVVAALVLGKGRRRPVAYVLGGALAASVASTFLIHDQLRAYYGTDVRAAELLAGALLAVVVTARPAIGSTSKIVPVGGVLALAAIVASWVVTTQTDDRLYHGGLLLHAALVVMVILAARRDGSLATLLSVRPLRWLGRISYGAYLYHWPIFLWLSPTRTGLSSVPLAALRVTTSLVAASLSARLLEEPIRTGARLTPRHAPAAFAALATAIAACLVVVTASPPHPTIAFNVTAAHELIAPAPLPSTTTSTTIARSTTSIETLLASTISVPTTVPRAPGEPLRVYVAGDSNAFILGLNLGKWGRRHNMQVWTSGWFACNIVPGGTYRWAGQPKHTQDKCNSWHETRSAEIAKIKPHIVLIIYGSFDLLDRQWDGSDEWTHVGLPAFDRLLATSIAEMTDMAGSGGARVVWATYPRTRTGVIDGIQPEHDFPEVDEYRVDRLNTLIRESVAFRPFARILELRRQMQAWPNGELDPVKRPDGIHPNEHEAKLLSAWIGEQLSQIARQ